MMNVWMWLFCVLIYRMLCGDYVILCVVGMVLVSMFMWKLGGMMSLFIGSGVVNVGVDME